MLPSGWVTFAFTDIVDSTRLARVLGAGYQPVLRQYRRLFAEAVRAHRGVAVFTGAESCFAAFPDAAAALRACLATHRSLAAARWPGGAGRPEVRIGLHTGAARARGGEYASLEVHRAARVTHAAHPDQVLCTAATATSAAGLPREVRLRDLGLFRLRGFDGRERLFQVEAPGWPDRFPPPRAAVAAAHNLPAPLTSFVGRVRERAALGRLLADHRLVSVTGAAGLGKSRLAVRVAADRAAGFPDGVWYLDLAGGTDPAGLVPALAATLGLPAGGGWPALARFLATRGLLLVLDGCDGHTGPLAPVVARVLAAGPRVRVLATGREPVGVPGELVWRLRPLPVAGEPGDAVALLADRARAARGGMAPDRGELAELARIAAVLDGVPLALERAAARLRVLSAGQLAARLERPASPAPVAPAAPARSPALVPGVPPRAGARERRLVVAG